MVSFDPYAHVIKPRLAEARETPFDSPDHLFELKWDGTRALAFVRGGKHRFQNRRLSFIEGRYPDLAPHTRKDAILDAEIDLALQLLKSMTKEFDPGQYRDRYRDGLMALIQAKVEGKELPTITRVESKPTQDLMAALKASLEVAKAN